MCNPVNAHSVRDNLAGFACIAPQQTAGINGSELYEPEKDRCTADGNTTLGSEVFDIAVTQIEAIVQPDCVADYVGWEPMALIRIHPSILTFAASLLGNTGARGRSRVAGPPVQRQ